MNEPQAEYDSSPRRIAAAGSAASDFPDEYDAETIAQIIHAAGIAASELPDEYDAVDVLRALPEIMQALEDTADMMDYPHAPGHAARREKVHNALAAARGE